ncbi:MAG: Hpt domain-containing protein [Candidatus Thiodiazotropha sp.]
MNNAQDFGALNWVKDELDVSIRHARQALEAYVESPGDGDSLAVCGDHLHQIARVLQMVQVYGPSMLAEEMELVVRDMAQGRVRQEEDAAEALMLALIQLPDYLEKLQGGDADIPLIILPLLNDLRAVRDAPLLSEAALFKPEIDTRDEQGQINDHLPELTRQVRQKFHLGLLSWYRKRDTVHGWPLLRDVFATMRQHAGTEQVKQLFWVAEGLMHGLIENTIAPGIAVKQLFSRLDRKMKTIVDSGEQALVDRPPAALLKNLLYYIARADSHHPLIQEIKETFHLDTVMPSEAQLSQGRLGLTGSNAELAESIKDAVSTELTRIKDILDLFMRDEKANMEMLAHLESPTRKLADTLGMIGQGALRSRLNRQADKVKNFVEQGVMPEEFELMEMAGDILYVESSLSTLHTFQPGVAEEEEDSLGLSMPEGEYQNLIKQTVKEAKLEIAKAKEAIISFTEAPDETTLLENVHQGFKRVQGALNMLNMREAAELLQKTGNFIQQTLIEARSKPSRQQMNSLADVVSSIEYYLETLVDGAGDRREILAIAQSSLNDLLSEGQVERTEYTTPVEPIEVSESADHAEGYDLQEDEVSDLEFGASSLQIEPPQPQVEEITADSEPAIGEPKAEPEPVSETPAEPVVAAPEPPVEEEEIPSSRKPMLDEIDPEILEIFIEEAREELEVIQEHLPRWERNYEDRDALVTFRRSFHTLKGSGRLVGAKVIGELAWSVENMLNRLIDETIHVSPDMIDVLNRVVASLPDLINSQEQGVYPSVDVDLLQAQAYALADGKPMPQMEEPAAEEAPVEVAEPESSVEEAAEAVAETAGEITETSAEAEEPELLSEVQDTDSLSLEMPDEVAETQDSFELPEELEDLSLELDTELSDEEEPQIELQALSEENEVELEENLLESPEAILDESLLGDFTDSDLIIEIDTELLEVFAEESEEHLQEIEAFLRMAEGADPAMQLPESVVRACHTLHGSAQMTGIMPIAQLSEAMEDYANAVHDLQRPADDQVLGLIGGSVGYIRKLLDTLPDEDLSEPNVETYLSGLRDALQQLHHGLGEDLHAADLQSDSDDLTLESEPTSFLEESSELDEAPELTAEEPSFELEEAPEPLPEEPSFESEEAPEPTSEEPSFELEEAPEPYSEEPSSEEPLFELEEAEESDEEPPQPGVFHESTTYLQEDEFFEVGDDEELLEIFIEEGRELLESLEESYTRWENALHDGAVIDEIKRTLHTLKGSSRLAGILPIGDVSHGLESLFERILRQQITADQPIQDLVRQAFDFLATQVEDAATTGKVHISETLLHDLENPSARQEEDEPVALEESDSDFLDFDADAVAEDANLEEIMEALEEEPVSETLETELEQPAEAASEEAELSEETASEEMQAEEWSSEALSSSLETAQDEELQQELERLEEDDSEFSASEAVDTASYYEEPMSFLHDGDLFEVSEDRELVEIFVEESKELLETLEGQFQQWSDNPSDHQPVDAMQRALHTIKGSSRLAGIEPVGDLSHAMESLLNAVTRGLVPAEGAVMNLSRATLDLLATQTDDAESSGRVHRADPLIAEIQSLIDAASEQSASDESFVDPEVQQELEALESEAAETEIEEVEPAAVSNQDLVEELDVELPDDAFAIEDITSESLDTGDDSFMLLQDEVLLEVGEDEELIQIFIEEAKEFTEQIETNFQNWLDNLTDRSAIDGMQRNLHTLKGSARLAGVMPVGDLSHAVESLMTSLAEGEIDPIETVTDTLRQAIDHLALQVDTLAKTGKVPASDLQVTQLHNLLGGEMTPSYDGMVETIQQVEEPQEVVEEEAPKSAKVLPFNEKIAKLLNPQQDEDKESQKASKDQVRVNAELMDRLVNHAGEVSIYRARLEQQNSVLGFNLSELEQTVSRLYTQLRGLEIETEAQILYRWERDNEQDDHEKAEFDPLELDRFSNMQQLSRALVETVNDLGNINESLRDLQRETDTLLLQQSRISNDLQDGLLRTRMVPFATLVPRMQRLVRQTAGQLSKKANLECFGIEGELDRSILNRMVPVLEHLLRNSVSHGIEYPQDRVSTGKQETGRISLYLDREATDVLITLSDDGRGLDIEAIRARAIKQGMINANAEISDDDLIQCVLLPGFSTAKEVTQISGRGVGLDVVVSEVKQLGGSLEIDSQPGRGTSFIIRLPLTLAITDALLVRVGEEIYAIPHGSVSAVVRIRRQDLQQCYADAQNGFEYAGKQYKVSYLGRMMGVGHQELQEGHRWLPLLLLQTGEHQVALQVDELLGSRQVVVKSLGKQVGSVRWITGGTILADGRVALILDLSALVRMDATHTAPIRASVEQAQKRVEERVRVMVVDDSITVRKVTSRLLERHDMEVVTAKDGVEAVALLQEQVPDIMLLDIEMPRMDGFELARHINNSVDYYGLPIIMISSRVGDKHRQRAMDLGVKRCLGKPYQESELLENINEVLAESRQ